MKKNEGDESRAETLAYISSLRRGTLPGKKQRPRTHTISGPPSAGCADVRDINDLPRLTRRLPCTRVLRVRRYNAACMPLFILFARRDEAEILRAHRIVFNDKSLFRLYILHVTHVIEANLSQKFVFYCTLNLFFFFIRY